MSSPFPVTNAAQPQTTGMVSVQVQQPQSQQINTVDTQKQKHQATLKGLAIAEITLGVIVVIFGTTVSGIVGETASFLFNFYNNQRNYNNYNGYSNTNYNYRYRYSSLFNIGEGIWCGIWMIIAGALGIGAAKFKASRCMIQTHLAFSIVSSIFSGILVIIASIGAAIASRSLVSVVALDSLQSIIAFVLMILHILSASYSCAALGCCCTSTNYRYPGQLIGHGNEMVNNPQPVTAIGIDGLAYTQQQQQTAAMHVQGPSNFQQGYVLHGAQPMVQTTFPGTQHAAPSVPQQNQAMNLSSQAVTETKQREPAADLPPSYDFGFSQQ